MQSRNYCFTINNPKTLPDVDLASCTAVKYFILQEEIGDNGTHHLQGYVQFKGTRKFDFVQNLLPRAHIEQQRGTNEQARDYCKKQDATVIPNSTIEWGVFTSSQGSRTDIIAFKEAIDNGMEDVELYDTYPHEYFKYAKMVPHCRNLKSKPRDFKTHVSLILGPSGAGKSHYAQQEAPKAYRFDACSKYWNGFNGQEDVIFDDYRNWFPYSELLQLLDRYPKRVYPMYMDVNFAPKRIIITSTRKPKDWYPNHKEDIQQLLRRIDTYIVIEDQQPIVLDRNNQLHNHYFELYVD